jgi:hypothetical protein
LPDEVNAGRQPLAAFAAVFAVKKFPSLIQ